MSKMNFNYGSSPFSPSVPSVPMPSLSGLSNIGSSTPKFGGLSDDEMGSTLANLLRNLGSNNVLDDQGNPTPALAEAMAKSGIGLPGKDAPFSKLLGSIGTGVGIAGDIANIILGFKQNSLAKKELNSQIGFANANLGNTVDAYNTRLADIRRSRGFTQGDSSATTEAGITADKLKFRQVG